MRRIVLHILATWVLVPLLINSNISFAQDSEIIAVIVHESVDTKNLDINDLINIYTLSRQNWENNDRIRVADYKGSPSYRRDFYDALDTTPNNIKRIWLRAQFTGRSIPPKIVNSIEDMVELVIENPGTIGYVPLSQVPANSKIIMQIDG